MRSKANYDTKRTSLSEGLTRDHPKFPDKSCGLQKSPSVNDGATRGQNAPTPTTLGPRKTGMGGASGKY